MITRLNGVGMIDFTDPAPKNSDGVIGFQIHGGKTMMKIRFKNVLIRDLTQAGPRCRVAVTLRGRLH